MRKTVVRCLQFAVMMAPYPLLAWGCAATLSISFWIALALLVALRILFNVIDTLGETIAWRLMGRRQTIQFMVRHFRDNKYPLRRQHVGFPLYLDRLLEQLEDVTRRTYELHDAGAASRYEEARSLFLAAQGLKKDYEFSERQGGLQHMRWESAVKAAFELHSPLSLAPRPSAHDTPPASAAIQSQPLPSPSEMKRECARRRSLGYDN